jgi:hypothetical protein
LRHVENRSDIEEEMVYICEPEVGKTLIDEEERSVKGLINWQVGRDGLSSCQVGNGKRSVEDIIYFQRGSTEILDCQVGNEVGSVDLIDW